MALKPNESILGGLALLTVDYATFQVMLPNATDLKQVEPFNRDVESSRKTATIVAMGICAGISLLARDPGLFVIGGGGAVLMSFLFAHADSVSPITGKVATTVRGGLSVVPGQVSDTAPDTDIIYVDEQVG